MPLTANENLEEANDKVIRERMVRDKCVTRREMPPTTLPTPEDAVHTIMAFSEQILEEMDVKGLAHELQSHSTELWKEVKMLKDHDDSDLTHETSPPHTGPLQPTTPNRCSLSLWILHVGWKDVATRVRQGVEGVFEGVVLPGPPSEPLKTKLGPTELHALLANVRRRVEYEVWDIRLRGYVRITDSGGKTICDNHMAEPLRFQATETLLLITLEGIKSVGLSRSRLKLREQGYKVPSLHTELVGNLALREDLVANKVWGKERIEPCKGVSTKKSLETRASSENSTSSFNSTAVGRNRHGPFSPPNRSNATYTTCHGAWKTNKRSIAYTNWEANSIRQGN
ncbi:hypothetical protein BV22DRAFT_1051108 [Leucogyrophana mollusca]|uniref:Uncharacterized protein n=1 Tax=Leucogyrophana mollusca TaxID=85980 RepID=A0ACB8B2K9_9AGAM|nr:hypothetical protein BV22DRAFT_1051108 [Leucogyrophana mollusca]